MSDRWTRHDYVQSLADVTATARTIVGTGWEASTGLFLPPRRAILAMGIVGVPLSMLAGGDLITIGFVALAAFTAFFMGHVERRPSERVGGHSVGENAERRPHTTTTTAEED